MSIAYNRQSRRMFLLGAGQAFIALPLLPSLLPKAEAQAVTTNARKMMLFGFDHTNFAGNWMSPSLATTPVGTGGLKEIVLSSMPSASSIAPIWTSSTFESLRKANQISIFRGMDITTAHVNTSYPESFYDELAHNFMPFHMDTVSNDASIAKTNALPTIESILESCKSVIPNSTPATMVRLNDIENGWYTRKDPATGALSQLSNAQYHEYAQYTSLYNNLFGALVGTTSPAPNPIDQLKANILNRILPSYNSAMTSRKISSADKSALSAHMQMLSDLQKNYSAGSGIQVSCTKPAMAPTSSINYNSLATFRVVLNTLAAAFKCGVTRVGIWALDSNDPQWLPQVQQATGGKLMHDFFHGGDQATCAAVAKAYWGNYCNEIADNFLAPLNVTDATNGRTYLDNMVVGLMSGGRVSDVIDNHNSYDVQQILFGSMGGLLRAGSYYSFPRTGTNPNSQGKVFAIPYNAFMITLVQLMGAKPADYAFATSNGKGLGYYPAYASHPYQARFYEPIAEILA